jgi:hypothetical protein
MPSDRAAIVSPYSTPPVQSKLPPKMPTIEREGQRGEHEKARDGKRSQFERLTGLHSREAVFQNLSLLGSLRFANGRVELFDHRTVVEHSRGQALARHRRLDSNLRGVDHHHEEVRSSEHQQDERARKCRPKESGRFHGLVSLVSVQ